MKSASSDDAEAARIGVFLTDVAALWIVNTYVGPGGMIVGMSVRSPVFAAI